MSNKGLSTNSEEGEKHEAEDSHKEEENDENLDDEQLDEAILMSDWGSLWWSDLLWSWLTRSKDFCIVCEKMLLLQYCPEEGAKSNILSPLPVVVVH